jgi:hygromycin-B 7''-O-kinase
MIFDMVNSELLSLVLVKHGLGELISFSQIEHGNWKQNLLIESRKGNYVFRGVPLFENQFEIEFEAIKFLNESKNVIRISNFYLVDSSKDIVPFKYAIYEYISGKTISLNENKLDANILLAENLGILLAKLHNIEINFNTIEGYSYIYRNNYYQAFTEKNTRVLESCLKKKYLSKFEYESIKEELLAGFSEISKMKSLCFVHGDYTVNNVLIGEKSRSEVIGLIDFSSSHFGYFFEDIPRQFCMNQDIDKSGTLNERFLSKYRQFCSKFSSQFLRIALLCERLELWEFIKNEKVQWVDQDITFSKWIQQYQNILEGV